MSGKAINLLSEKMDRVQVRRRGNDKESDINRVSERDKEREIEKEREKERKMRENE